MLTRREFFGQAAGATVTLVLTPLLCASCSNSTYGSTSNSGVVGCDGAGETSTVTASHTHTLCVPAASLAQPPVAGESFTTSSTAGHSHEVSLSQAQLQAIAGGQTVAVTTSMVNGHTHGFSITKMAQGTPTPTPGYG